MERDQVLFRLFGKYSPEGTILATEGSPGEELYFVQSGAVRVGPAAGGRDLGRVLGAGGILGEEAFFSRAPRPRRAEIVRDARLLQVSDRNLDSFVRHGPESALNLLEGLIDLEGQADGELRSWSLAHTLRRAAPHLPRADGAPVTTLALEENAGLTAAEARLLLEELERRGGLVAAGDRWRVADPARLERAEREIVSGGGNP